MFLKVGVYNDKLALARAEPLLELIRHSHPDVQIEKKTFPTRDTEGRNVTVLTARPRSTTDPLLEAVAENRVDFAVFNLKDLPMFEESSNLLIAATPERSSPCDVLVARENEGLKRLKPGSQVGASTLLRIVQLRKLRPDLKVEPIGGNVEARLSRLDKGEFDAIILAESGMARLGMSGRISQRLSLEDFMPMPGQGVTALVCRRDNQKVARLVKTVDSQRTRKEAEAERELLRLVRAQCRVPLGAYASTKGDKLQLSACIVSSDGQETIRISLEGHGSDPIGLAKRVAELLFDRGALRLEDGWRNLYPLYDD